MICDISYTYNHLDLKKKPRPPPQLIDALLGPEATLAGKSE